VARSTEESPLDAAAENHRVWFRRTAAAEGCAVVDTAETQLFLGREAMLFPESALDVDALMVEIRARECRSVGCWSLSADAALGTRLVGELSYHRSTPTRCRTIPLSCSLIGLARPLRRYCGSVASRTITDESQLRAVIGSPADAVVAKIADRLNDLTGQFIERSPFVCVATASPDGGLDVSPRGDPAGFVRILDERTLLIPDRPGNRIADTLTNLLVDPRIALLFLIPGVGDTFRVNGRAAIIDDPDLLTPSSVEGRAPRLGILITIEEAYTQCAKALIRSDLWNPGRHIDRSELPSGGEMLRSLTDPAFDAAGYDRERAERYARRERLY
jgi:PPOX class probable FMN-dependent enzyme